MRLIRRKLVGFPVEPLDYDVIHATSTSLGHADLCAVLDRARKDHVLEGVSISTQLIVDGIADREALR